MMTPSLSITRINARLCDHFLKQSGLYGKLPLQIRLLNFLKSFAKKDIEINEGVVFKDNVYVREV